MRRAKPTVGLSARIPIETHERKRRLERITGKSAPELLDLAFREYEKAILSEISDEARERYFAEELRAGRFSDPGPRASDEGT
jgi:hypothetical protein